VSQPHSSAVKAQGVQNRIFLLPQINFTDFPLNVAILFLKHVSISLSF
jgi:hypothetical protein